MNNILKKKKKRKFLSKTKHSTAIGIRQNGLYKRVPSAALLKNGIWSSLVL